MFIYVNRTNILLSRHFKQAKKSNIYTCRSKDPFSLVDQLNNPDNSEMKVEYILHLSCFRGEMRCSYMCNVSHLSLHFIGTQSMVYVVQPVCTSTSRLNLGSEYASLIFSSLPDDATQPAIPFSLVNLYCIREENVFKEWLNHRVIFSIQSYRISLPFEKIPHPFSSSFPSSKRSAWSSLESTSVRNMAHLSASTSFFAQVCKGNRNVVFSQSFLRISTQQ